MEFAEAIMAEVKSLRALDNDSREGEAHIRGLKRAVEIILGREEAERLFARYDESY